MQERQSLILRQSLLAIVLVAMTRPLVAGQEVAEIPFFNAPPGTAALGAGMRLGQSLYRAVDNEDQRQFDLIPLYLYNGKWIFARGTAGGVHFLNRDTFEFNLLFRYRFNKLDPDRNEFYAGMESRQQTVEGGLEARWRGRYGDLNATFLTDVLDRHTGQSADLSYRYNFDRGSLTFSPFISWAWNDTKLTNYYFGVRPEEATPERPFYEPGESQWIAFGLNTTWWLTDRISLFGNVGFGSVDTAIANSPLVEENSANAVFLGGTYIFGNVRKPERFVTPERAGEWSWRVNYGYQVDGNIVSEIDQGDFSKSTVADTRIGGVTVGKLLTDGPRIDFYGRFALMRHFESDEGNGQFNSYNAYIMAMGRGYSGWTNEEVFRWGFGFGMSYADKVPIAEQRKQEASGNNTARFLNYLEMQLDFPLRRLFKNTPSLHDCYAGLTVVHRSGIFGTSDILGDVSGGSDWITAHVECAMGRDK